jgi:hypothetical protein
MIAASPWDEVQSAYHLESSKGSIQILEKYAFDVDL